MNIYARTSTAALLVLTTLLAPALAGCASSTLAGPTASGSPSTAVSETAQPSHSATPSQTAAALSCEDLLPAAELDSVAPGFVPDGMHEPTPDSYAAQIEAAGGVACGWSSSGGGTLTVAVAQPGSADIDAAETGIGGTGTPSNLFGSKMRAWTINGGGTFTGDFEVFTDAGYWVSSVSSMYGTSDSLEAQKIITAVLQNLPSG